MFTNQLLHQLLVAAVFSALGLVILGVVWLILVKVLPFSLRKEMEDDQAQGGEDGRDEELVQQLVREHHLPPWKPLL